MTALDVRDCECGMVVRATSMQRAFYGVELHSPFCPVGIAEREAGEALVEPFPPNTPPDIVSNVPVAEPRVIDESEVVCGCGHRGYEHTAGEGRPGDCLHRDPESQRFTCACDTFTPANEED